LLRSVIPVLIAVTLLAMSAAAQAHTVRFDSAVSIDYNDSAGAFFGTVSSPRAGCIPRRLVTLYRDDEGADTALGSDRTNQAGNWQLAQGIAAGTPYYAKVARKDIGGAGHNHICKAAESSRIAIFP
jgi:hypothetical protein